jgi:glycosyltransferase involved in cell wall biosynthesis
VLALARGGALETVIEGETGSLVHESSPDALADGMRSILASRFDATTIRAHAERFGRERFVREMQTVIAQTLAGPGDAGW